MPPSPQPEPNDSPIYREAEQLAKRVDHQLRDMDVRQGAELESLPADRHVLHIDDNEDDRTLFARAFAAANLKATLHSLCDVSDAFLYLARLGPYVAAPRPKLIVLDLNLPDRDGRYLLTVLKSSRYLRDIPVVILSGSESFADIQRCRDLCVDDYVVKPSNHQAFIELISAMAHWLTKSATRQSQPPGAK